MPFEMALTSVSPSCVDASALMVGCDPNLQYTLVSTEVEGTSEEILFEHGSGLARRQRHFPSEYCCSKHTQ